VFADIVAIRNLSRHRRTAETRWLSTLWRPLLSTVMIGYGAPLVDDVKIA